MRKSKHHPPAYCSGLIHIHCLPKRISKQDVVSFFSSFGKIDKFEDFKQTSQQYSGLLFFFKNHQVLDKISEQKEYIINNKKIKINRFESKEALIKYINTMRYNRIFIKDLPAEVDNQVLQNLVFQYGDIKKIYFSSFDKNSLRTGFIIFEHQSSLKYLPKSGIIYKIRAYEWSSYSGKKRGKQSQKNSVARHQYNADRDGEQSEGKRRHQSCFKNDRHVPQPHDIQYSSNSYLDHKIQFSQNNNNRCRDSHQQILGQALPSSPSFLNHNDHDRFFKKNTSSLLNCKIQRRRLLIQQQQLIKNGTNLPEFHRYSPSEIKYWRSRRNLFTREPNLKFNFTTTDSKYPVKFDSSSKPYPKIAKDF